MPLHLPSTFTAFTALTNARRSACAMLGEFGLTWPWESLHVEALAWFDHWLKGRDTGILEGRAFATSCRGRRDFAKPIAGRRRA